LHEGHKSVKLVIAVCFELSLKVKTNHQTTKFTQTPNGKVCARPRPSGYFRKSTRHTRLFMLS